MTDLFATIAFIPCLFNAQFYKIIIYQICMLFSFDNTLNSTLTTIAYNISLN